MGAGEPLRPVIFADGVLPGAPDSGETNGRQELAEAAYTTHENASDHGAVQVLAEGGSLARSTRHFLCERGSARRPAGAMVEVVALSEGVEGESAGFPTSDHP